MANIGRLTVDLRLTSQKFSAGLKKATGSLNSFRDRARSATAGLGGMQARIAGIVGVAGMGAMISQSLKAGDALGKMSDRLSVSTESLSAMRHLIELNGESADGLEKSMQRMARGIGEAERGFGTASKAFKDLGLSIEDISGKNADEQFFIIGDAIKSVENASTRASLSADIFGRSGINLLNTMQAGRDGFESAKEEVEKYGLALTRVDAAKIEAANDAIFRAQQAVKGVSLAATVELAPILEEVSNQFIDAGTEGDGFAGKIKDAIRGAVGFIGVFADGIRGIKVILKGVETAVKGSALVWAESFRFIVNDVLVPFANMVSNIVLAPLREILEFGSKFSGTAQSMLDEVNKLGNAQGFQTLTNIAGAMRDSFNESKQELQSLMLETIPSEAMLEKIDEIYETAGDRAEKVAEKSKQIMDKNAGSTFESSAEEDSKDGKDNDKKIAEEKSYLDRLANLQITNSKKIAAFKQGMNIKTAIMNMYTGVSEAVKLGWPAAIPATAFALAEGAVAIQGIKSAGSFLGGGHTGKGARVGGIDGKGGMSAIVHPDEMVDDLTKGQPGGALTMSYSPTYQASGLSIEQLEKLDSRSRKRFARIVQSMVGTPV